MANLCITSYAIKAENPNDTFGLYYDICRMGNQCKENKEEYTIDKLLNAIGMNGKSHYGGRVLFSEEEVTDKNDILRFTVESDYQRVERIEQLIELAWYGTKVYFFEDNLEDDILQTNDINQEFFKTEVALDTEENGMDYYETHDDALEAFNKALKSYCEKNGEEYNPIENIFDFDSTPMWASLHNVRVIGMGDYDD